MLGEASDGAEAVKLARQLKPDILLLDLAMPKHPGSEALRDLKPPGRADPVTRDPADRGGAEESDC